MNGQSYCNEHLIINDETMKCQNEANFLGVTLDEKLTWADHIICTSKVKLLKYYVSYLKQAIKLFQAQSLRYKVTPSLNGWAQT